MTTNDRNKGTERAVLLRFSGARLADFRALQKGEQLLSQGALVELDPLPITGPQVQHYQALSGLQPGNFGFFDTLAPRNYTAVEEAQPDDATPKLLPHLLRSAGWTVHMEKTSVSDLAACVQRLTSGSSTAPTCLIITCTLEPQDITPTVMEAVGLARAWAGETGLFALLSDTQPAQVRRFVNLNNFLAEMGIIERDELSGNVDWANSLAYFVGHGQLWINQLGREPQGAVHPQEEYAEVCDTLVEKLPAKCRDAETGELVIERIYRKEELYADAYLFKAPDLVVIFKPGYAPSPESIQLSFDDTVFFTATPGTMVAAGVHPTSLTGFLFAASPAFAAGVEPAEHSPLTAVVPTLLHALGMKHGPMDAVAVSNLFTSTYLNAHPILDVQEQDLSDEEEELVIGRLRDLGYV